MLRSLRQVLALIDAPGDVDTFPWENLRAEHIAAIRARLIAAGKAPATCNRILAAIRGVLKAAEMRELMPFDQYRRAVSAAAAVPGSRLPAGHMVTPAELSLLLAACAADRRPSGVRDAALIGVLYAGVRRFEAAAIHLGDVEDARRAVILRSGKGNKARIAFLAPGAWHALIDWIARRGDFPGALFVPVSETGAIETSGRGFSVQAIYQILQRRSDQAGIAPVSPHDLRRTVISVLLESGVDLVKVSKMVGHTDPKVTARYDRRPELENAAAAARLPFPYMTPTDEPAAG